MGTINFLPSDLAQRFRAAGLTVVEIEGWRTRTRPASTGGFAPVGVLNTPTGASAKAWTEQRRLEYSRWMTLTGRPSDGLPAPLSQIGLGPDGTVYLQAAGRANHAGKARARGSVAAGDGNFLYVGVEWMLSGTEAIPPEMMDAGLTVNAVLLDVLGSSEETVAAHYETSVTGKWDIGDPQGLLYSGHRVLDMGAFRDDVRARSVAMRTPVRPTQKTGVELVRERLARIAKRAQKDGKPKRWAKIKAALKALPRR